MKKSSKLPGTFSPKETSALSVQSGLVSNFRDSNQPMEMFERRLCYKTLP